MKTGNVTFAPELYLRNVAAGIAFYETAFEAVELRRWSNEDGSVHVAEMSIGGAMFHLHEERPASGHVSPESSKEVSTLLGVFSDDPDKLFNGAVAAGGRVVEAIQDFDYGYRQGIIADPFDHQWMLQKKI